MVWLFIFQFDREEKLEAVAGWCESPDDILPGQMDPGFQDTQLIFLFATPPSNLQVGAMLKCAPSSLCIEINAGLWALWSANGGVYGVPRDGRSLWRAYRAKMLCCKFKPYATHRPMGTVRRLINLLMFPGRYKPRKLPSRYRPLSACCLL